MDFFPKCTKKSMSEEKKNVWCICARPDTRDNVYGVQGLRYTRFRSSVTWMQTSLKNRSPFRASDAPRIVFQISNNFAKFGEMENDTGVAFPFVTRGIFVRNLWFIAARSGTCSCGFFTSRKRSKRSVKTDGFLMLHNFIVNLIFNSKEGRKKICRNTNIFVQNNW